MSAISRDHLVSSVRDALQFISYYHPLDFVTAIYKAYQLEQSPAAKSALAQILINSRMCAEGHRPICQDTGIVVIFVKMGIEARWEPGLDLAGAINEGVRQAYTDTNNPLRASVVSDPAGKRINTGDNTPAVIHTEIVPGDAVELSIAAKGGGSENKARFTVLNPSDDIVRWITEIVPTIGAGWCPPGILGIGIGGTAEKAMLLAKQSLLAPIDIQSLVQRGPKNALEELRLNIYEAVNQLGIGAQGLGGLTTVLDIKILDYPTHAASKPVAMIPNCAATRHIHFSLNGTGPAQFEPPSLKDWPLITEQNRDNVHRINLDSISREQIQQWRPGDTLLLSGKILTGRDAAHKRLVDMLARGEKLPVDFTNRFIYYVGPVDAVRDEAVGPAGPTTATRMDKFTEVILAKTGLVGMIGKAERGPAGIDAIKKHGAVYLIATGGAAYLVSKSIRSSKVLAFADLGMEAIHEFEIEDMPVTVAVDCTGNSIHQIGPTEWRQRIKEMRVDISRP